MADHDYERPRSEPEIIPPDRIREDDARRAAHQWSFQNAGGFERIYVTRIGPFGMFLLALAGGALAILFLLFIVGAFLIWIPIVGLMVTIAILSSLLRSFFHHPR